MSSTKPKGKKPGRTTTSTSTTVETRSLPLFASAQRRLEPEVALAQLRGRPDVLSTGLQSVDRELRGGFPVGAATLVAARPKVGATSFLIGAALEGLKRGETVAYFSERLRQEQIRGRFVVLESRVNGHRFRAGFISAQDRIALNAARDRIPWNALSIRARRRIDSEEIDSQIFSYRPWLVIADVRPRLPDARGATDNTALMKGIQRLAAIAAKHRVALVLRWILNRGAHVPDVLELPGVGAAAEPFHSVILLHREGLATETQEEESNVDDLGRAEAHIVRAGGKDVEPRTVQLRFDQRFAGLLER